MSSKPDRSHARRCLMPPALLGVLTGVVPAELASELSLPTVTSFESLDPISVDISNLQANRHLLDHLTRIVRAAIASRRLNLSAPAFPNGVSSSSTQHVFRFSLERVTLLCGKVCFPKTASGGRRCKD